VVAAGEGYAASGFPGSLRQNVLPIRGQGVHKAGSCKEIVARCVFFFYCKNEETFFAFHNGDTT